VLFFCFFVLFVFGYLFFGVLFVFCFFSFVVLVFFVLCCVGFGGAGWWAGWCLVLLLDCVFSLFILLSLFSPPLFPFLSFGALSVGGGVDGGFVLDGVWGG